MFKKSLAIILSISMCLGLMIQGSFAFTYPYTYSDLDTVWNMYDMNNNTSAILQKELQLAMVENVLGRSRNSNIVISASPFGSGAGGISWFCCESSTIALNNSYVYTSEPNDYWAYSSFSTYGYSSIGYGYSSDISYITVDDSRFYYTDSFRLDIRSDSLIYSSCDIYINGVLYEPENLDISDYQPDPRYFSIFSDDLGWAHDMIAIATNDVPDSDSYVSFDYTDSLGSWHTFLDVSDGLVVSGEGVNYIYFDPLKISLYQFTLTGGTYYGSDEWGYYDYTCDLDFNENPIDYNTNFYDSYYYYNTTYTNYDNVRTSGFVFMYGNPTGTEPYYWDEYDFLIQPFKFSIIALPIVADKNTLPGANIIDIFVNSYSDSYDILLLDVPETYFNYLYGVGSYADLRSDLDEYPTAIGLAGYINDWYSSNFLVPSQFPYSLKDSGITHTISQSCGIIYTDSFFYKQLSYLIGDNSDILSEFSERFFKPNGFSDYLMSNLADMYNQDYDYYSDSLSYLTKINYYLNDAFEKQYLPSIVSSLTSSNSYLLSIDTKLNDVDDILVALSDLSYLSDISTSVGYLDDILTDTDSVVTGFGLLLSDTGDILDLLGDIEDESSAGINYLSAIDGDLGDLLEWFQNQEDSDVVLMLPEFDSDVLIEIYGSGIGEFVDWFNTWISVLPDFDYSEFPDFFDNISDLIDEFADSNDDLIGNLDTPYEYNDSKLHYLGWD